MILSTSGQNTKRNPFVIIHHYLTSVAQLCDLRLILSKMNPMKDNRAIGILNAARKGRYGIVGACCVSD